MDLPMIEATLAMLADQPLLAFLLIVGLTYLLEDATAVAAGALAMAGKLDPALALAALLVGTISGDLLLHGMGRMARRNRWIAQMAARHGGLQAAGRSVATVASARFVPGLRLPAYVGSGIAGMPVLKLLVVVTATALVWTPLLFLAGSAITMGGWGPALAGATLFAMLVVPRVVRRVRTARVELPAACA
jgi:membrane protein DedA with SNARE-associated domain